MHVKLDDSLGGDSHGSLAGSGTLIFKNLCYTVELGLCGRGGTKKLLTNVDGWVSFIQKYLYYDIQNKTKKLGYIYHYTI